MTTGRSRVITRRFFTSFDRQKEARLDGLMCRGITHPFFEERK